MMKKYTVVIEETVVGEFEITAESKEEAVEIARKKYKQQEVILEPGELQYAQIAVVEPCINNFEWIEI